MALEHLAKMSQNEILRERALEREKNWVAYHLEKEGLLNENMEKGIKKGMEKGIKKGMEKGIKKEKQAIILTMIELNYSESEIAKVVKCPEDEIKKLMK